MANKASGGGHDDVYTMKEAARLKGVSYHTVSRAVRSGSLAHQRIGRMAFVPAAALAAWRPMVQRAPKTYRRREPDPSAAPAMLDLVAGDRVALAERYAVLAEVVHAGAVGKDATAILALVCDRLKDALVLRRSAVWGFDEPAGTARCLDRSRGQSGAWPDEVALGAISALVDFAAGAGKAVVVPAGAFGPDAAAVLGTGVALVAPVRSGGRTLGLLVGDRGGNPFAPGAEQLAFARALAGLAGAAVEADRLRRTVAGLGDPASASPVPEPPHARRLAAVLRRLTPDQAAVLESVADALLDAATGIGGTDRTGPP